jgi:hypothetical protein
MGFSTIEKSSAEHFAMTALQKISSRVHCREGKEDDMDERLRHVAELDDDRNKEYLKPDYVEDVACYLICRKKELPKVFMRWDMDPSLISQALVQAHCLDKASKFSNRTDIIACWWKSGQLMNALLTYKRIMEVSESFLNRKRIKIVHGLPLSRNSLIFTDKSPQQIKAAPWCLCKNYCIVDCLCTWTLILWSRLAF